MHAIVRGEVGERIVKLAVASAHVIMPPPWKLLLIIGRGPGWGLIPHLVSGQ